MDECVLGGMGFTDFFIACVSSLSQEDLIKRSPKGKRLGVLLDAVLSLEVEKIADIAQSMITSVNECIAGNRQKLPSAAQAALWTDFHQLRTSKEMKQTWNIFLAAHVPNSSNSEPNVTLQLLLDRLLKKMLSNKVIQINEESQAAPVKPLTAMESNAVRYMAGYVAVTLLKRYKKPTKHPNLKTKRELFVCILTQMRAYNQPGEPSSVLEYTTLWSELIDRGGLYHISDEVTSRLMHHNNYCSYHVICPYHAGLPFDGVD